MSASVSSPIMVGRDVPIARLDAALDEAIAGRPRVVVLGGEAGIGKSRLLAELEDRARSRGVRVLIGGCLDLTDGGPPFLPFVEAFRRLVRSVPPDERATLFGAPGRELAPLLPELTDQFDQPAGKAPSIDQGRLFELVLTLIGRLAEEAPLVLAIEDAHWIDRASRDLVTFLARNLSRGRVALVLTWRTDHLESVGGNAAWLAELLRGTAVERLELPRLDRDSVAELVRLITGKRPEPGILDRTFERSDGNPFFVEELLAAGQPDSAPPMLVDVLASRLAGLSAEVRGPLAALAVAGRPVDDDLLGEVLAISPDALNAALREGIGRFVLELDPESAAVRFRHALLREVAAAALLPGERRALHERFARALERRVGLTGRTPAGLIADLARHWDAADRPDEAYEATVRAALSASMLAAHGQAHELYERALVLADRRSTGLDGRERIVLLRQASDEADLSGDAERALHLIGSAIGLAKPLADPVVEGELRGRRGFLLWRAGDPTGALEEHQAAVALVPDEPPGEARARALAGLGGAYFAVGRYEAARDISEAAVACAEQAAAPRDEARARNTLGSALVALGDLDGGLRELERSRDIAALVSPPETVVATRFNLALNLAQAGRLEDALSEVQAGRGLARESGLERRFGMDLAALAGDILMRLGRWDDADDATAEGSRVDLSGPGSTFLAMVRGRLESLRGNVEAASTRFAIVEADAAEGLDADVAAYLARGLVERDLATRAPNAAVTHVDQMTERLAGADEPFAQPVYALGAGAAADLAEDARASRDDVGAVRAADLARGFAGRIAPWISRPTEPGSTATVDGPINPWLALAEAELVRASGRADPEAWRAAAAALADLPEVHLAAYANLRAAEADLRLRGVRAEVGETIRSVHETVLRLRAEPLRQDIESLARRARVALEPDRIAVGGRPRAPGPRADRIGPGPTLSAREIEVLRLVADGRTNGEIAERLFITRKTASVHVTHILDKLGVANRFEAAMAGSRLGLVGDAEDGPGGIARRDDPDGGARV